MKLLISTMLRLIYWDGQPHTVLSGDLGQGFAHYHGVTWDTGRLYVSGAHEYRYGIYVLNPSSFEVRDILFNDLHETHQIFWYGGKLYVTNTGKNRVEVWDGQGWNWVAFNPSPHDIDHINGIGCDGERLYFSEFRHKVAPPSVIRVCGLELNLLDTLKVGPPIHNVFRQDDTLFSLRSREPCGLVGTFANGLGSFDVGLPQLQGMLLRGLARSADNWFVGASRWETERDKRHVGDALVVVLDNAFEEVDRIEIPDAGPVCDVRLVDLVDLAHNGMEYPGI